MGSVLRFGMMLMAFGLPALASPLLEGRAKCNRDNLLRCYDPTGTKPTDIASRSAATAFCSSYLSLPLVTSVIATSTPLTTVTSIITTTDGTAVVTSVSTTVSVEESTTTTTVTVTQSPIAKRAVGSSITGPACAASTYAPSALSSACACLNVTPSTTYVTATAATSTSVSLSTVHDTTTTTTETTTTTTRTDTTTAVATSNPVRTCPPGSGTPITAYDGRVYCTQRGLSLGGTVIRSYLDELYQTCVDYCSELTRVGIPCDGVNFNVVARLQECFLVTQSGGSVTSSLDTTIAYPLDSIVIHQ